MHYCLEFSKQLPFQQKDGAFRHEQKLMCEGKHFLASY